MALIKINEDTFVNPDKIEAIEFSNNSIKVIMPSKTYKVTDLTGQVFKDIQKLTGSTSDTLNKILKVQEIHGG